MSSEFALKFEEEGFGDFFGSGDDGERDSCEMGDVWKKEESSESAIRIREGKEEKKTEERRWDERVPWDDSAFPSTSL